MTTQVLVERKWFRDDYTASNVYIDGMLMCTGLECAHEHLLPLGKYYLVMGGDATRFLIVHTDGLEPIGELRGYTGFTPAVKGVIVLGDNRVHGTLSDGSAAVYEIFCTHLFASLAVHGVGGGGMCELSIVGSKD